VWEEKLVAHLIAAPNEEMRKLEDKGQGKNASLQAMCVTVMQKR
jgi:hypothetical protein